VAQHALPGIGVQRLEIGLFQLPGILLNPGGAAQHEGAVLGVEVLVGNDELQIAEGVDLSGAGRFGLGRKQMILDRCDQGPCRLGIRGLVCSQGSQRKARGETAARHAQQEARRSARRCAKQPTLGMIGARVDGGWSWLFAVDGACPAGRYRLIRNDRPG